MLKLGQVLNIFKTKLLSLQTRENLAESLLPLYAG